MSKVKISKLYGFPCPHCGRLILHDREKIGAEIDQLKAEIESIQNQLETEQRDEIWRNKAKKALAYRRQKINELRSQRRTEHELFEDEKNRLVMKMVAQLIGEDQLIAIKQAAENRLITIAEDE